MHWKDWKGGWLILQKTLRMFRGEKRKLYVTIYSGEDFPFQIENARYEVWNCDMEVREAEGECQIDEHTLEITVCPKRAGMYMVKYILMIAEEKVIRKTLIRVSET